MTSQNTANTPTRRQFLALSGATACVASLGMAAWAQNSVEIDVDAISNTYLVTNVLMIGGRIEARLLQ